MHNIESRFVIGPENNLFIGVYTEIVYMCIFQPEKLTGWDSEGVSILACLIPSSIAMFPVTSQHCSTVFKIRLPDRFCVYIPESINQYQFNFMLVMWQAPTVMYFWCFVIVSVPLCVYSVHSSRDQFTFVFPFFCPLNDLLLVL